MKPLITIGILGTAADANLIYNVNTYIAQNYDSFEIIFALDKKQCVEVSDILNVINAQQFDIPGKIKIIEKDFSNPLYECVKAIKQEARGEYLLFLSIEDAFYDNEGILMAAGKILAGNRQVYLFKTAIRIELEDEVLWHSYDAISGNNMSVAAIYNKEVFAELFDSCCDSIESVAELQKELILLYEKRELPHQPELVNQTLLVHFSGFDLPDIFKYYSPAYKKMTIPDDPVLPIKLDCLNQSDLKKLDKLMISLKKFLSVDKITWLSALQKEYESISRLTSRSIWGPNKSQSQYISVLSFIYRKIRNNDFPFLPYVGLRYKLKKRLRTKKLKLLFLTNEYSVWPSLKSVFDTAARRNNLAVQLVYVPFYHDFSNIDHEKEKELYKAAGYSVISDSEYDLALESPDIVFYVKPYDSIPEKFQIKEVRKVVNTVVYIPYGMEIGNTKECLRYQCYCNMQYYASYILAYSPDYYNKIKQYTFTEGKNYLTIGHPRIDLRRSIPENDPTFSQIKIKADKKTIILWNTHFTLQSGDNWGSFLQYGDAILDYFYCHPELFLLWRPHPLFYKSLAEVRGETQKETLSWIQRKADKPNIFLDQSASYLPAFAASDVMISDWASFVPEYFSYGKRMIITQKQNCTTSLLTQAQNIFEIAKNAADVINFLEDVSLNNSTRINEDIIKRCLYFPEKGTVANALLDMICNAE